VSAFFFLLAYTCSGFAGLVYEVTWTRQLTLYMGHTTAAASTVVAAFMGGLAGGAALGGRIASRLAPRQCLYLYVVLETLVVVVALALPLELRLITPLLAWAYQDGAPGALFPAVRLLSCLLLMVLPAFALGATFPIAARWFVHDPARAGRRAGVLYAMNTAGAAIGALATGFVLIPTIGISGATRAGVAASIVAAAVVLLIARRPEKRRPAAEGRARERHKPERERKPRKSDDRAVVGEAVASARGLWLAAATLGVSGFASLTYEIAWTRVLALLIGPTTYAFAATLGVFISGLAIGSGVGSWAAARTKRPAVWMAIVLLAAAVSAAWSGAIGGNSIPRYVARVVAASPDGFAHALGYYALLIAAATLPAAIALGAAFPLAFAIVGAGPSTSLRAGGAGKAGEVSAAGGDGRDDVAARLGMVYAVNTIGAVAGSLLAGFYFIPAIGIEQTLRVVSVVLIGGALLLVVAGQLTRRDHLTTLIAGAVAVVLLVLSPAWDRALLASGAYRYAPYVPAGVDLETALKAGSLLYYRDGAAATVSVKELTGTLSLAIDGKVDASNGSDILTQKLIAHLPLLLHGKPREVAVIGLGSGITLESALTHPVSGVDVLEISPEVVEASKYFAKDNRDALSDPRTRLIVGDGRSHLLLTKRRYDVIISEPSNPWIAGVASLFTREFFSAARARLAPHGIICQWAHTYNMSDADLRSIVSTFTSVFPNGTAWLIGQADVLLIASAEPLDAQLANVGSGWSRAAVADDLKTVAVREPFSLLSLFAGGPAELAHYGAGAAPQTDDRTALEFSAPYQMHSQAGADNAAALVALLEPDAAPPVARQAVRGATAAEWRNRAAMMLHADMHPIAFEDYLRALGLDASDAEAYDGFVQTATASHRAAEGLERLRALGPAPKPGPASPTEGHAAASTRGPAAALKKVAESKLLMADGQMDAAMSAAKDATEGAPALVTAHEQVAEVAARMQDANKLDAAVDALRRVAPDRVSTYYYSAVARFLRSDFAGTLELAARAVAADASYAPVYDLMGAAHTKLGQPTEARDSFLKSLKANARDSSAYANLGVLELAAGNREAAANYFAEALWLDPQTPAARDGLKKIANGIKE